MTMLVPGIHLSECGAMIRWVLALVAMLSLGTVGAPLTAGAQSSAKAPRIGVLSPGAVSTSSQLDAAFTQGLREHGYVEGQNIVMERRFAEGRPERISEIAAELVRLKMDVIATSTDVAIAAVKQQTQTIPIVMANSTDPVGTGFVANLARPGGNVTGLTGISPELSAKRMELLKEVVPGLSRVAIMWNPDDRGAVFEYKEAESAARSLRLQLQSVEVSRADDFERAFSALRGARAEALIVVGSALAFTNRGQIACGDTKGGGSLDHEISRAPIAVGEID